MGYALRKIIAATVLLSAGAARPESLSLAAAIDLADRNSPALASARAEVDAARGAVAQAQLRLQANPAIELEYASDAFTTGAGDQRLHAMVRQEVEVAGQPSARRRAAVLGLEAAEARLSQVRADVRAEVTHAYARVHSLQRRLALARGVEKLAVAVAEAALRRLKEGDVSEVDAAILAADAARFRAQMRSASVEIEAARRDLGVAVGWSLPPDLVVDDIPEPPAALPAAEPAIESLAGVATELRAAAARREELSLVRLERLPTPSLAIGYEREASPIGPPSLGQAHVDHLIVARVEVPIPLWNRRDGEIARAAAALDSAQAKARAALLVAGAQVRAARTSASLALEVERSFAEVLPRAEKALGIVEEAFRVGQLGLAEYRVRRDALYQAQVDAIEAQLERVRAVSELQRLLVVIGGRGGKPSQAAPSAGAATDSLRR
ncbi:MAG: TolC family protein [Myxococcales bacterium]|nr:TolC family protein [Myxococcales bacterium]